MANETREPINLAIQTVLMLLLEREAEEIPLQYLFNAPVPGMNMKL